jgi:hypothetical protein
MRSDVRILSNSFRASVGIHGFGIVCVLLKPVF